ncbi:hypothetical protein D3C73_757190 [compost metagenome]
MGVTLAQGPEQAEHRQQGQQRQASEHRQVRMGKPAGGDFRMEDGRPHTDHTNHRQQQPRQGPGEQAHPRFEHAFGLDQQPGAAEQRISDDQTDTAEQRKRCQPVQRTAGELAIDHRDAGNVSADHHALGKGRQQRTADERHVPDMTLFRAGLETELERHTAKDQAAQHQDQRQVQRFQNH